MSAISQIAQRVLGGRRGAATTARPTTRPTAGRAPAGGSSTDAAIGRGVRGLLGRLRR